MLRLGITSFLRRLRQGAQVPYPDAAWPPGHFYSPLADADDLRRRAVALWPPDPHVLGIDWNEQEQLRVLTELFPRFLPRYDYPEVLEDTPDLASFYTRNGMFTWLDPRALFVLLNEWRPRRMIEVGSGYSTLLAGDVNRRFLGGQMHLTCIEPHPPPFLQRDLAPLGIARLLQTRVELVDPGVFAELRAGDVLFIDSSHVAKTGSDVNFLVFEVLPRLPAGVRVHFHDIFLPHDYPYEWAVDERRNWNEQYVVRALLTYTTAFKVLFASAFLYHTARAAVAKAVAHPRGIVYSGSSLWLERL